MENNNQQNSENLDNQFNADSIDEFLENEGGEGEEEVINKKELRRKNKMYIKYSIIVSFFIIVFSILLVLLYSYSRYYSLNGKEEALTSNEQNFINTMDTVNNYIVNGKKNIYSFIGINTSSNNVGNVQQANLEKIDSYLSNSSISFVEKKSKLEQKIKSKLKTLKSNKRKINKLKSNISKYGFLPKEVNTILINSSLQRSLISIEAIKLFTALKIFYYFDSFLNGFLEEKSLSRSVSSMREKIEYYKNRGENDTYRYLKKCYLNPYEISKRCSSFKDFSKFYNLSGIEDQFSSRIFKKLMTYINNKLENESNPKLSIILNNLDPNSKEISFNININTYKEDQQALLNWKGENIMNPHIFISSTLISLLRESHFIIGKTINVDTLKVSKKKVKQGEKERVVNNSSFSFSVPVQDEFEREIYDYVYEK